MLKLVLKIIFVYITLTILVTGCSLMGERAEERLYSTPNFSPQRTGKAEKKIIPVRKVPWKNRARTKANLNK